MCFQQELKKIAIVQLWHFVLYYAGIIFKVLLRKVKVKPFHEVLEGE